MTATEVLHHPKPHEQWTTVLLPEIAWDWYDRWPDYLSVAHEAHGEWRVYVPEATLGRGECQDLGGTDENGELVFNCSECGCMLSLYDRDGINNLCTSFIFDYPRYCPECGRKVVNK